jgi:hypothetical protein
MIKRYQKLFESKKRFIEFTLADLKSGIIDDFRKPFAKERQKIKGTETNVAKLVDAKVFEDNIRFYWLTEPTFSKRTKVINPETLGLELSSDNYYTMEIEIVDLKKWFDTQSLPDVTLKEFKEVMSVADAKMFCSCPSFHLQGSNFEASQLDSSVHPTEISNDWWRDYTKSLGCKHLSNLLKNITFWYPAMLSEMRKIKA